MNNINQLKIPAALALTAGASILIHDTSMDKAAATVLAKPNQALSVASISKEDVPHDHLRGSNTNPASTPRAQTRLTDDKKYIINKRLVGSNNDFDYIWPSV